MSATVNGEYRYFRSRVSGHTENSDKLALRRIAISFNSEQIEKLNDLAQSRGCSFSKAVSDLVGIALEEVEA